MALFDPAVVALIGRLATAPSQVRRVQRWRTAAMSTGGDHVHAIPTVYCCLAGTARVLGGPTGRLDLAAGEALVIAPGVRHGHVAVRRGSVAIDLGFVASYCDFELEDATQRLWARVPREPYAGLCRQLLMAPAEERIAVVRQMLDALSVERIEAMGFPHPAVRPMAQRLWANAPGLTAAQVLAASGLQTRRAHAVFTTFFGQPPKQAILAQRLALAAAFLDDGATVTAAAQRAGFLRRADLTRAWTVAHGTPPTQRG